MQIVIDIPESQYKTLNAKSQADVVDVIDDKTIIDAIKSGVPLPKGHGRISDMDAAIKCIEEVEGEDAIWAISLIEWACGKRTLIEADKEE